MLLPPTEALERAPIGPGMEGGAGSYTGDPAGVGVGDLIQELSTGLSHLTSLPVLLTST